MNASTANATVEALLRRIATASAASTRGDRSRFAAERSVGMGAAYCESAVTREIAGRFIACGDRIQEPTAPSPRTEWWRLTPCPSQGFAQSRLITSAEDGISSC